MQRVHHDNTAAKTRAREVPALFWFVVIAAVAATLLLVVSTVGFQGLDRLLPDGEPFLPYFTT